MYGLSNAGLDTPWPKVVRARAALSELLEGGRLDPPITGAAEELVLSVLADRRVAPDEALPDTGVGLERERLLAPAFITSPVYGTRSSTLLLLGRDGAIHLAERSFDPGGSTSGTVRFAVDPRWRSRSRLTVTAEGSRPRRQTVATRRRHGRKGPRGPRRLTRAVAPRPHPIWAPRSHPWQTQRSKRIVTVW